MKIPTSILLASLTLMQACGGGDGGSNSAPVIEGTPASMARIGEAYSFRPQAFDVDGNLLTFSISNAPDWLFFDEGSGEVTGYPTSLDYGPHADIVITVSDGSASTSMTFSLDVLPPLLTRDNFLPEGTTMPTEDGFQAKGTLVMSVDGKEQRFENSNLLLSFDEDGNLLDLAGDTLVPPEVADNLSLDAGLTATVGMLSGAEISARPEFGITLKDELYFFVYHFAAGLDVGISTGEQPDGSDPETLTLTTPLGGEILLITDPNDIFYYYFADLPAIGNAGKGQSVHGFIPFVPALDYAELSSFDGHLLDKASMGLGIKIFDFFNLSGTRVIRLPIPGEINYDDLFASPAEFNMGMNGAVDFAFSILGVGFFDFSISTSSATLEVSSERQHMAMQTVIAPDVSWQPSWFSILPETEIIGNWAVDGSGEFSAELSGDYRSTLPEAAMSGSMLLSNAGASFSARIPDAITPLAVSASFEDEKTIYSIDAEVDMTDRISAGIDQGFNEVLDEKLQAFDDLTSATENYEFEVSLRGFRDAIPAIADTAVTNINNLPDSVASIVYNHVYDGIKARQFSECVVTVCVKIPTNSKITSYANSAKSSAKTHTANRIGPYKTAMQNLKARALEADDEQLRIALELALRAAYDRRRYKSTISGTVDLPSPLSDYDYSKSINIEVLNDSNAAKILEAANNVQYIQSTSDIKISAADIYAQIPVEAAVEQARQELADGLSQLPSFGGAGMTVADGSYSAYILLDGVEQGVDGVNILDPIDLLAGITHKAASLLSGGE